MNYGKTKRLYINLCLRFPTIASVFPRQGVFCDKVTGEGTIKLEDKRYSSMFLFTIYCKSIFSVILYYVNNDHNDNAHNTCNPVHLLGIKTINNFPITVHKIPSIYTSQVHG